MVETRSPFKPLPCLTENIPLLLKQQRQWCLWRLEYRNDRPTKVPYQPNGQYAQSDNPETWWSYDNCLPLLDRYSGLGYFFSDTGIECGIDLDHCYDSHGQLESWAAAEVERFQSRGTYIEKSPSGDGLHILCQAKPIKTGSKKWQRDSDFEQGIELYCRRRFFCITGHAITDGRTLKACQDEIEALHEKYFFIAPREPIGINIGQSVDIEEVKRAFEYLDANDYETWIESGMACRRSEVPFEIWNAWSAKSAKYSFEIAESKWRSFKDVSRISVGSIFHRALQNGFKFATNSSKEVIEYSPASWPKIDEDAFYGLAGDFVKEVCEHSEADPVAVLIEFLNYFGCLCGNKVYTPVGDTRHPPRLYTLVVGNTSKGRKGTASALVMRINGEIKHDGVAIAYGPMSSGEGLTYQVRDPGDKKAKNGELEDLGVEDKRLFIVESEFARVLSVFRREGNTLSGTLRSLWDSGNSNPLTKTNRLKATNAHVCIAAQITKDELLNKLHEDEVSGGTINRFLVMCTERKKSIPLPRPTPPEIIDRYKYKLLQKSMVSGEIDFSEEAKMVWIDIYKELSAEYPGRIGRLLARQEALTKRLALIYCLLDGGEEIQVEHLRAALALSSYHTQSIRYLFPSEVVDSPVIKLANKILEFLQQGEKTQNQLMDLFGRNISSEKINEALRFLDQTNKVQSRKIRNAGRPKIIWLLRREFNTLIPDHEEDEIFDA